MKKREKAPEIVPLNKSVVTKNKIYDKKRAPKPKPCKKPDFSPL
jgi:hypothetical protein